jgi:uncharacterized protein with NRDE domain
MCLIVFAHAVSPRHPLILAANRDEDHQRPARAAHFWEDAPDVLGGRDLRAGGGWLAITTSGRWAAVTNLRGGAAPEHARSRGALVGDFVRGNESPRAYVDDVARHAAEYAGFHLLAGVVGGEVAHFSVMPAIVPHGIHAISNAPHGEVWPKSAAAMEVMDDAIALGYEHAEQAEQAIIDHLLRFLTTPRGTGRIESEPFIVGERYGTRSSTVILASSEEIVFVEQNWKSGGVADGERRVIRAARAASR